VEILRLFQEINRSLPEPLDPDVLVTSVQANLPALGEAIARYRDVAGTPDPRVHRSAQDMFEEVVLMLRELRPTWRALPGPWDGDVGTLSEGVAEELRRLDTSLASGQIEPQLYLRLRTILLDRGRDQEGSEH
jgi:hypothetical protein